MESQPDNDEDQPTPRIDCSEWIETLATTALEFEFAHSLAQEILATRVEVLRDDEIIILERLSSQRRAAVAREIYVVLTIGWRRHLLHSRMINNLDANQCLKACFTFPTDQDEEKVTDVWSKGFSAQEKEIFNLFERMFQPLVPLDDRMEGWENTIAGEMLDEDLLKEGSEEWLKRAQEDMYAIKKIVDEYHSGENVSSSPSIAPSPEKMMLDNPVLAVSEVEEDKATPSPPELIIPKDPVLRSTSKLQPPPTKQLKSNSRSGSPSNSLAEPTGRMTRSRSRSPGLLPPPIVAKKPRTKSPSLPPPNLVIEPITSSIETTNSSSLERINPAPKPSQRVRNQSPLPVNSPPIESQIGPSIGMSSIISKKLKREARRQSIKLEEEKRKSSGFSSPPPPNDNEMEVEVVMEEAQVVERKRAGLKLRESEILMPPPSLPLEEVDFDFFGDTEGLEEIQSSMIQDTEEIVSFLSTDFGN